MADSGVTKARQLTNNPDLNNSRFLSKSAENQLSCRYGALNAAGVLVASAQPAH